MLVRELWLSSSCLLLEMQPGPYAASRHMLFSLLSKARNYLGGRDCALVFHFSVTSDYHGICLGQNGYSIDVW
jgi:hypothetical protein